MNDEYRTAAPKSSARFAQRCAYLAGRLNGWAGDCLIHPDKEVSPGTLARFLEEMRERLDWIEEDFGPPRPRGPETLGAWLDRYQAVVAQRLNDAVHALTGASGGASREK